MDVQLLFEKNQLVTFRAMQAAEKLGRGKPQILSVEYARADWGEDWDKPPTMRYYVRCLCSKTWSGDEQQSFFTGERLVNGLALVEESELVAVPLPDDETDKAEEA